MATRLPQPLRRRELLYGIDTPPETLSRLADVYLEADLTFDAAAFFAQAGDRDGLRKIKDVAIKAGDAFLLRQVWEAASDLVAKADWDELAKAARSLGKDTYAARGEAGGTPPPPPLQEELAADAATTTSDDATASGGDDSGPATRPGRAGKRQRKREIQGG